MSAFSDKVAIVTGGAGGVGRALCEELATRGAAVVVADLDGDAARAVAKGIGASGANGVALDVAEAAAVQALVDSTVDREGRLDFMFNNAGVGIWGDARDLSLAQWQRVFDVNFWGAVHGSLAAYGIMARQGFGHIVNVSSLAGLVSAPTVTPYAAAKHAVVGLSTSLRAEAEGLGVRVSVVCPGPIRSGFHGALMRAAGSKRETRPPSGAIDAKQAARAILAGVEKNRRVIVFPGSARWLWALSRIAPWQIARLNRRTVRGLRAARSE